MLTVTEVRFLNSLLCVCVLLLSCNLAITLGLSETWDAQTAILESISQGVERPVSTTYTDIDGLAHTIPTPRDPEGNTAHLHKIDLCNAFNEFQPQESQTPTWWRPGMDCSSL